MITPINDYFPDNVQGDLHPIRLYPCRAHTSSSYGIASLSIQLGVKTQRESVMNFEVYKKVQNIAKEVHGILGEYIDSKSTKHSIAEKAIELLIERGITDTWYHGVPAFVLLGSRSCESIFGRDYNASNERVKEKNLITVDLSPKLDDVWGDCARSFFVENGKYTIIPECKNFQEGASIELDLHRKMVDFVTPNTLFSELYEFGNKEIKKSGFENLDFLGNLGHSIETDPSRRRFIDKNCSEMLGEAKFFTFEPHIRKKAGEWGYKHENIYYFNDEGHAVEL
jgi:Xaa-Pro aminopeptidase